MHLLIVALIFVATMASPAVVAVKFVPRTKRELALAQLPAQGRLIRVREGRVVVPVSVGAQSQMLIANLRSAQARMQIKQLPFGRMDLRA